MILEEKYPSSPTGVVTLEIIDREGNVLKNVGFNLVVSEGFQSAARSLGGDTAYNATQFAVGEGTDPAVLADTYADFVNPFKGNIATVTYPANNEVQFTFTIDYADANGLNITEFGLLSTNDNLIARRVRANEIVKSSDIAINGTWKIIF